jgi:hypothetical protein
MREVGGFAYMAHAVLAFRLLRSALPNVCDERAANASALATASVPYLAAVWAPAGAARSLFWAADRLQQGRVAVLCEVLKWLHRGGWM